MRQVSLFDVPAVATPPPSPRAAERVRPLHARARRDAAVAAVEGAASEAFLAAALAAVRTIATTRDTFIVDDVWAVLGPLVPPTRDKRAMGAVLMAARREGLIQPTEAFRASAQPQCHANPRRVWASCRRS